MQDFLQKRCLERGEQTIALASKKSLSSLLVRPRGFEPPRPCGHKPLKLACLPIPSRPHFKNFQTLRFTRPTCLSQERDLNPRPAVYKTAALPLSYPGTKRKLFCFPAIVVTILALIQFFPISRTAVLFYIPAAAHMV